MDAAGIAWHEKTLGQLFCDGSATQVIDMLLRDMERAGVTLWLGCALGEVRRDGERLRGRDGAGAAGGARGGGGDGGQVDPEDGGDGLWLPGRRKLWAAAGRDAARRWCR